MGGRKYKRSKRNSQSPKPTFVLDTNATLDLFSMHDLADAMEVKPKPSVVVNGQKLRAFKRKKQIGIGYRAHRAASAILAGAYFDDVGATTIGLEEVTKTLLSVAPPATRDQPEELATMIVTFNLYFVRPMLWPRWRTGCVRNTAHFEKGAADDEYLRIAHDEGFPLITNEGWKTDGSYDEQDATKLRHKAGLAGVPFFSTGEFVDKYVGDPSRLIRRFFRRWDRRIPQYLAAHRKSVGEDLLPRHAQRIRNLCGWLFYPDDYIQTVTD